MMRNKLKQMLRQTWPIMIAVERRSDGSEYYAAALIDFPGCIAEGNSRKEARDRLASIKEQYFQRLIEIGAPIPPET
ncbi:type II toxin-antitoxin system HicB family antitoxin, partial [Gemmatimonadota bacterium]